MIRQEANEKAQSLSRITAFSRRGPFPLTTRPSTKDWLVTVTKGNSKEDDAAAIEAALVAQLGKPFASVYDETPVRQVLLAILAERCLENDDAMGMLARFVDVTLSSEAELDRKSIDHVLGSSTDLGRNEIVGDIAKKHHYSNTVLLELLDRTGRRGRLLAPSLLMSFQAHDVSLWRLIDSAGRPDLSPDTAMVVSHWRDEKLMGKSLEEPFTGHLVASLKKHVGAH